jgi:hypothetical protein
MAAPSDDNGSRDQYRVLVYSHEPIVAAGLESTLRQVEGFEVMPMCATLAGLMEQIGHAAPNLALVDLTPDITFAVLSEIMPPWRTPGSCCG